MCDDELQRIRKETIMAYSRYYPVIFLEVLSKVTESLSQDSSCPFRDSNWARREYKAGVSHLDESAR
jgi:hypothetical protein